ncbi:MAG: hypothetical protein ABF274_12845 [Nonlabens sp.]|jgi:CRISPR/Cas system Type II protein with McrA/HNH and RuvC-like nuclease domain|uniref:hypothetical protein n=1 Tax=Nonlabens sp. TaxID=1888209 RepID=UPI003219039D
MSIEEALQKINSYRIITTDSKSLKLLDKWNELLLELNALEMTYKEQSLIENELDVQMKRIESARQDKKVIKESLRSTLSFLKNMLHIKDSLQYTTIGTFGGLLLPLVSGISILFGLLIGMAIGVTLDQHFNSKQRNIKTNLHDTW